MRIFRHQLGQVQVANGSDEVFADMPIPSECTQNNVWGKVHIVENEEVTIDNVVLYGVDGFVLAVPDPDTLDSVDDLWDRLVDKDDDLGPNSLDLDETAADTDNLYEAGEPSVGAILDAHIYKDDNHWFRRRGLMSFATSPTGFHWVTSEVSTYQPRDFFKIRARKPIYTEYMSMSLLGLSMPNVVTFATVPNSPSSNSEWLRQKYIEVVLEQAWMSLLGVTEAGAETPWEDAASLVQKLVEPGVYEDTTGVFQSNLGLQLVAETTWDITVPGRREIAVLSGEN